MPQSEGDDFDSASFIYIATFTLLFFQPVHYDQLLQACNISTFLPPRSITTYGKANGPSFFWSSGSCVCMK